MTGPSRDCHRCLRVRFWHALYHVKITLHFFRRRTDKGAIHLPTIITAMGRSYFDLVLPTTKHERVLGLSTLSYKMPYRIFKESP